MGSPAVARTGSEHEPDRPVPGAMVRHGYDHESRSAPARRRRRVVAAGGTAVVATAILAGAYVVGGEQAATAEELPGATALRAGWDSVAPRTPAYLDAEQLETLRAGGWYCPELESLGFSLKSAEGITVAGRPTLELVLENDGDTVTVYEQRKVGGDRDPGGPLSPLMGNTVASDGFEHIGGAGRDVWVRDGEPWQVVLDSPSVTYTVVADLPAAAMPQTLRQLVTTERAQLSLGPGEKQDSTVERIIRGLATITTPGSTGR